MLGAIGGETRSPVACNSGTSKPVGLLAGRRYGAARLVEGEFQPPGRWGEAELLGEDQKGVPLDFVRLVWLIDHTITPDIRTGKGDIIVTPSYGSGQHIMHGDEKDRRGKANRKRATRGLRVLTAGSSDSQPCRATQFSINARAPVAGRILPNVILAGCDVPSPPRRSLGPSTLAGFWSKPCRSAIISSYDRFDFPLPYPGCDARRCGRPPEVLIIDNDQSHAETVAESLDRVGFPLPRGHLRQRRRPAHRRRRPST